MLLTHIGATASGIISDARVLIERAQVKAQQHRITYDTPIDTLEIVKNICDLKQLTTQSGGYRPFGVSVLVAGIDPEGEPKLYQTDPTGIFFQFRAVVIGEGEEAITETLHKKYKPTLNIDQGLKVAIDALKEAVEDKLTSERLDIAIIRKNENQFRKLSNKEIEAVIK